MEITDEDKDKTNPMEEKVSKSFKRRKKKSKRQKISKNTNANEEATNEKGEAEGVTPKTDMEDTEKSQIKRRSRRSRSSSTKRIKEFFRKSSETRRSRSGSPRKEILDNENDVVAYAASGNDDPGVTDLVTETSFINFNPVLKPRDRLRRMTVKEATKERLTRKSPRRLSETDREKSSSLPDLQNDHTHNTFQGGTRSLSRPKRKSKSRSKSADMRPSKYRYTSAKMTHTTDNEIANIDETSPKTIPSSDFYEYNFAYGIKETDLISEHSGNDNENDEIHSDLSGAGVKPTPREIEGNSKSDDTEDNSHSMFIDSEKSRRESFSKFLELSQNMPSFSSSSLAARARSRDVSPLSSCTPHEEPPVNITSVSPLSQTTLKLDSHLTSKNKTNNDQDKSKAGNSSSVLSGKKENTEDEIREQSEKDVKPKSLNEKDFNAPKSFSEKPKEEQKLSRGEYKSPRRFTGRSRSGERKRKQGVQEVTPLPTDTDKIKDKTSLDENTQTPTEFKPTYIPTFSPKARHRSRMKNDVKTEKTDETLFDETAHELECRETTSLTESPKQSPKRSPIKEVLTSRSVQTSLQSLLSICDSNYKVKYTQLQPDIEIIDSPKEDEFEGNRMKEKETDVKSIHTELKPIKQLAKNSETSDRSGSDADISPFRTPNASPLPGKKFSPDREPNDMKDKFKRTKSKSSKRRKSDKENDPIQISKVDDENEKENFFDASDDITSDKAKPPRQGKLSISAIVAIKRKLMRQRKRKAELAGNKSPPEKEDKEKCAKLDNQGSKEKAGEKVELQSLKSEDDRDTIKQQRQIENETKIIIENETNVNLSKLCKLEETDIIEELLDSDDTVLPLPKKQISFDPITEPIASDECLDDVILRERRSNKRFARRRESKIRERQKKVINCCKRFIAFLFSHIGLSTLVVAYSILGGVLFKALEGQHEVKTRINVTNERQKKVETIYKLATELQLNKRSRDEFSIEINKILKEYQTFIYIATNKNGFRNDEEFFSQEEQWSLASSLLFAITIMTTIGYGHVAPKTNYGRIVTIGYAVFGIPLTLLCLTNIGDLMATGFRLLYAKVCCGVCCILFSPRKRRLPDPEKGLIETDGEVVVQTKKSSSEVIHVPTSVCILLMTSYIMLGTLLFCLWEGWDVVTGAYFSFITLSTIGLGDVVPGTDWDSKEKLVLCALYLVFGLSLIAMCFNLVQEDVKAKFRWLGSKIGLFDRSKT